MIIPPMRGSDSQGRGYFGAPRGERTHKGGQDFVFVKVGGEP